YNEKLIISFIKGCRLFSNYVLARKQPRCLRLINCCIGRFYGRCPNLQFLKKLSKLFCSFADNLALAKFQRPTDTPLNHIIFLISYVVIIRLAAKQFSSLCPLTANH
ncbi:hypothetical protein, partial [Ruminococcus sp.]|uniref:hypothetical protein n=1 Tax=Ruminococcus sp. TaxID=41978 RepID=UPI003AB8C3CC